MCFTTVSRAVSRGCPTVPTQFLGTPLNTPGCPASDSHGHRAHACRGMRCCGMSRVCSPCACCHASARAASVSCAAAAARTQRRGKTAHGFTKERAQAWITCRGTETGYQRVRAPLRRLQSAARSHWFRHSARPSARQRAFRKSTARRKRLRNSSRVSLSAGSRSSK